MTDLTVNTRPRTIRLKGVGTRLERAASSGSSGILPGSLLRLHSDDTVDVHNISGKATAPIFAVENELFGKGIDDSYAANDYVQAEHFSGGDWVLATVAAGATAILEGDLLESNGDGTLKGGGTDYTDPIAMAMESVDNSGGGTVTRIKVAIL